MLRPRHAHRLHAWTAAAAALAVVALPVLAAAVLAAPIPPPEDDCDGSGPRICATPPASVAASVNSVDVFGQIANISNYGSETLTCKKNGTPVSITITGKTVKDWGGGDYSITYTVDLSGFSKTNGDTLTWTFGAWDYDTWLYYEDSTDTDVTN